MKSLLILILAMVISSCQSNEKRASNFSFDLNGQKFNYTWSNITENDKVYVVEVADTLYHFAITFNKSNWYGKYIVEISKNNVDGRYKIDSTFTIDSKSTANGYEASFSGGMLNLNDTIKITNGQFYQSY